MKRNPFYPLTVPKYCQKDVLKIINGLYGIPRTGFVDRQIKNCETVGEHTDALVLLAEELFPKIIGLKKMLKGHDWPEFYTGDLRTDPYSPPEHKISKKEKYELELFAMKLICSRLGRFGQEMLALWLEFELKTTERAKIAKQMDQVQSILKAFYYELKGEAVSAKEFYDYYKNSITEPKLIKKIKDSGIILN